MKRILGYAGYALILASLSIPAFAEKDSQNLTINSPVKVGSTELPAGNYKISWTGTGSDAQVTFAQKGRSSVTVPAKIVEQKNGHVATLTDQVGGVSVLESIQLNKLTLNLAGASASGE